MILKLFLLSSPMELIICLTISRCPKNVISITFSNNRVIFSEACRYFIFKTASFGQIEWTVHIFLILGFFDGGFVGQINVPKKCNSIGKKNSILNWNDAEINQLWYCPNFPISKKSRDINLL